MSEYSAATVHTHFPPVISGYACAFVHNVKLRLNVGLLPQEQDSAQDISVTFAVYQPAQTYLSVVNETSLMDYARLHAFVMGWENQPHVDLLETLAQQALDFAFQCNKVDYVFVYIAKMAIFENANGAGIHVLIHRK
jgi:dihydroneopterin aldolase